jgi:hypothetical protein
MPPREALGGGVPRRQVHSGVQARIAETFPAYRRAGSLGKNAFAGQECPAYRVFEIAAFIPAPAYRQAGGPALSIDRGRGRQAQGGAFCSIFVKSWDPLWNLCHQESVKYFLALLKDC